MRELFFISGDWPFFFREQLAHINWMPQVYRMDWGFGENALSRLWVDYPFHLLTKVLSDLGLGWVLTEKLWLIAIVVLAWTGMYSLSGRYFRQASLRLASSITYVANTYFFLVLGGGQLGVALAYALFPFVFHAWIRLVDGTARGRFIGAGVLLGVLVGSDVRISYVFILSILIYGLVRAKEVRKSFRTILSAFLVAATLHLYWVLPIITGKGIQLPAGATSFQALSFFSVSDFSHALSFLHPNWPENLFGRVYFQKPEFIILPILAFGALLASGGKKLSFDIRYFAVLGVVGAFLAKGTNEPFGRVYGWLFTCLPGFIMFRDPTKFYVLIALAYAILIPTTLDWIARHNEKTLKMTVGLYVLLALFLFRDAFLGKTSHSFQFSAAPSEYKRLKDTLVSDTTFSRVLWLPSVPHFAYRDTMHPSVAASDVFEASSGSAIINALTDSFAPELIGDKSIGYVVVPTDEAKNIFISDYTYDDTQRQFLIEALDKSGFLKDTTFTKLGVYRNTSRRDLFSRDNRKSVLWNSPAANVYELDIPEGSERITMRATFDPGWRLSVSGFTVRPQKSKDGRMQFDVNGYGGKARVYFAPDQVARTGALVSGMFIIFYCYLAIKRRA